MKPPFHRALVIWALLLLAISTGATAIAPAQTQPAPLVAAVAAYEKIAGYRTTAHLYQVQGTASQNSVFDYTFAKPSSISMTVVSGQNQGTTVKWTGGTDTLVSSLRGVTIAQLSFGSILKHAAEIAGTQQSSTTTLSGATVNVINLNVANPQGDAGLTREALYLSQSSNLPVRVDGFVGSDLVQTVTFEDTVTN
jgi:outer membrane lipoprotein-sorting protein